MEMRATDYCKYAEKQNKEEIISRHVINCFFSLLLMFVNYICQPLFFFSRRYNGKNSVFALYMIIVSVVSLYLKVMSLTQFFV